MAAGTKAKPMGNAFPYISQGGPNANLAGP